MNAFEKNQAVFIIAAVGLGLLLGQVSVIQQHASSVIVPFLMLMLFGLFLTIPLKGLTSAFRDRRFARANALLNFVWAPLVAYGLGVIFLADYPAIWLGFFLLIVTPCTDWYLVFTSNAKGNVPLAASVLPVNLILQLILLPLYLFLFTGSLEVASALFILKSMGLILFVPFSAAMITQFCLKKKQPLEKRILPFFSAVQLLCLCIAISAMFASEGMYLINNFYVMWLVLLPLLLFFLINASSACIVGRFLGIAKADTVSLTMAVVARNSPVALALVLTLFPDQPLIALALIIGPLIELPVLALLANRLKKTAHL